MLEPGKSKIKVPAVWTSSWHLFSWLVGGSPLTVCSYDLSVHRERAKSLVALQRALIPLWVSYPCDLTNPSYPPKGPIFKYHNLGGQDSNMWILWETQAFSPHQQPWVPSSVLGLEFLCHLCSLWLRPLNPTSALAFLTALGGSTAIYRTLPIIRLEPYLYFSVERIFVPIILFEVPGTYSVPLD